MDFIEAYQAMKEGRVCQYSGCSSTFRIVKAEIDWGGVHERCFWFQQCYPLCGGEDKRWIPSIIDSEMISAEWLIV